MTNIDKNTVSSFGAEWSRYAQDEMSECELSTLFETYFHIFPWEDLPPEAEGFDMGCGSGRWARLVSPRVRKLNCVDPSSAALEVARRNLKELKNVTFINAGVAECPIQAGTQDFGYSLGVLHHIPDTAAAMRACVELLKPGAPFLVYLYYRFDNKPHWYRQVWETSNTLRQSISHMPERLKVAATETIALCVYFPLARIARAGARLGFDVRNWLLSSYRDCSFYTMRTDARDRFGTPLEHRFTRGEIESMMVECGLERITFSDRFPFWCAMGRKK